MEPERRYLTAGEVGELLRCSARTIRRLVTQGELLGFRVGRRVLIPEHGLRAFIRTRLDEMAGADMDD